MKIIEVLNKIAKGEEIPKKIKYDNRIYIFKEDEKTYYDDSITTLLERYNFKVLTDEVEIIEENKKIPEKLEGIDSLFKIEQDLDLKGFLAWQKSNNKIIENKINEIIDTLEMLNDKIK